MRTELKCCEQTESRQNLRGSKVSALVAQHSVFFFSLCGIISSVSAAAEIQTAVSVRRVGFLGISSRSADSVRIEAFRTGLRELGYVEGKNIVIEFRYADGKLDRLPELAAELVRMNVDIIVARASVAVIAGRDATKTIPIIMASVADAVRSGFVRSLAHPGGNITGLTSIIPDLSGKRLELLREVLPGVSRIALLTHAEGTAAQLFIEESRRAAEKFRIHIQTLKVKGREDFESAFEAMHRERADALLVQPFFVGGLGYGRRLAELVIKKRVPAITDLSRFADEGGRNTCSRFYGTDGHEVRRQSRAHRTFEQQASFTDGVS